MTTENKDNFKIIIVKDDSINMDICSDRFVIIESHEDIQKIESIMNKKIDDIFDEWGFSDEYMKCDNCNNHITSNPYDGKDYAVLDNELICGNCIRDNYDINKPNDHDLIDEFLSTIINNPKSANNILSEKIFSNLGFENCKCKDELCSFDNGLHIGCDDNPEIILQNAMAKNPDKEFIFDIQDINMFNVNFTIYSRKINNEESD